MQIDIGEQLIVDGDRMAARVRATHQQGHSPKFAVDDEVNFDASAVAASFTIILKLQEGDSWDFSGPLLPDPSPDDQAKSA